MSKVLQLVDSTVNQYKIVKLLGTGAFVEVFLAKHTFLNIDRAIKVLHKDSPKITPDLFDEYCKRYKLEWELAARVHHPNLIEVYDLFEQDGALFAVLEYAPNGTLKDKLDLGNKYSEDWVVKVLCDCAKGLEEVHQLDSPSLVHCYVNPKTIVFDGEGKAKITNFGKARSHMAKLQEEHTSEKDDYNWRYQAPEFSHGKVAPTTDIYSLGCIAFEMLTGKAVASTNVNSPCQIEPSVPTWLDKVVTKMLSPDPGFSRRDLDNPAKRYVNMKQLLKVLSEPQYVFSSDFLNKIIKHFSIEELRNISMVLGVEYEKIRGDDVSVFAREMVLYFQRREKTAQLIEQLRIHRPQVNW